MRVTAEEKIEDESHNPIIGLRSLILGRFAEVDAMAPKNAGLGGSSHQRRIASKAENRIADEAAKKVLQRMETNVTNPNYPPIAAESHSFRAQLAAFWGSTPVWG